MRVVAAPRGRPLPGEPRSGFVRAGWECSIHRCLIEACVRRLVSMGYLVEADHLEGVLEVPSPIGGFVPDVFGRRGMETICVEAETGGSLNCAVTHRQLAAFCDRGESPTWVVVPHQDFDKLLDLRRRLGLDFAAVPGFPHHKILGDPR